MIAPDGLGPESICRRPLPCKALPSKASSSGLISAFSLSMWKSNWFCVALLISVCFSLPSITFSWESFWAACRPWVPAQQRDYHRALFNCLYSYNGGRPPHLFSAGNKHNKGLASFSLVWSSNYFHFFVCALSLPPFAAGPTAFPHWTN